MKKYNKLVRDRIPEIIKAKGEEAVTHIAGKKEFWAKLKEKLIEEAEEFSREENEGEIADILEVIDAIIEHKKFSKENIAEVKEKKAIERGRFLNKTILEES